MAKDYCISQKLLCHEEGSVIVLWALALSVIIGGIGLATDIGSWYSTKRNLQNTADVSVIAAAYDIVNNAQQTTMYFSAKREFTRNGFSVDTGSSDDVTLTVNFPPQTGTHAGSNFAVEVIASQPQQRFFSVLALNADPVAHVRALAVRQPAGSACVLALESLAADALLFQGNTSINLNNCIAAANSTNNEAIGVNGSSVLNAQSIYTAGNYDIGGNGTLNTTSPPVTNAPPLSDPYSGLTVPSYTGCNQNNYSTNGTVTLNPGVYCNGVTFNSQARVTMNPGTYIFDRGNFRVNGGAEVTGDGVTIILTSSTASNFATVTINGGAVMTLSAPATGSYKGVLFYQDQAAPIAVNTNKFNGGGTTNFTGALYFPKQELQFSGNNSNGGGACTKIVARVITFIGNSNMSNNCPTSVNDIVVPGVVQLVE